MTTDQATQAAMSLRDNEFLQEALSTLRTNALDGLVRTPATDADAIRDHQATVRVIDELMQRITLAIAAGTRGKRTSGVA